MADIESINRNETLVEEFLRFGVVRRDGVPSNRSVDGGVRNRLVMLSLFLAEYQRGRLIVGVLYTSVVPPRDNLPCPVPPFGQIAP